jgi:hypothetical protein
MGIQDKIEEIRRKPEHVRLRYVYLFTAISAVLIIIIWFISLSGQKDQSANSDSESDTQQLMNSLTEQKESITDAALDVKSAMEQAKTLQNSAK